MSNQENADKKSRETSAFTVCLNENNKTVGNVCHWNGMEHFPKATFGSETLQCKSAPKFLNNL
jgi:hypothetical protein